MGAHSGRVQHRLLVLLRLLDARLIVVTSDQVRILERSLKLAVILAISFPGGLQLDSASHVHVFIDEVDLLIEAFLWTDSKEVIICK